jgi:hypothetical protein
VKLESMRASGEAKMSLMASARELDNLAAEKGQVRTYQYPSNTESAVKRAGLLAGARKGVGDRGASPG